VEVNRSPIILKGEIPSPLNPPSGCVFHPRCFEARKECSQESPELREIQPNHWISCLRP
jgi:oligopeptide/dipeptide ABC transporter ATP-binding protein